FAEWLASNRDEDLVRFKGQFLVSFVGRSDCSPVLDFHAGHFCLEMKLDSLCGKGALKQIRELEIKAEGDARQKFQHRNFGAKTVPNRAKLKPNCAGANNEKFLWRLRKTERFSAANDCLAIEFRKWQFDRHASGRNNDVPGLDLLCFA